jgi:hypothetical protein
MNLTIRIPGKIDPDLNPNSHKHWRVKHRAQQDAFYAAYYEVSRRNLRDVFDDLVRYDVTIGLAKGERRKDDDNAIAMTKHYRDGMAHGLGMDSDAHMRFGTVEQVRDPEGVGYIEFRLTEISGEEAAA